MESNTRTKILDNFEDEIDFKELFQVLWRGKWSVFLSTSLFCIAAIAYSLQLPNIYQSNAILSPVEGQNVMNQADGVIASLAGINISSQSGDSNAIKAIAKLNTLSFFSENILPNIYLPDLIAVESWNAKTNAVTYKEDVYNEATKTWTRDIKYPKTKIPSSQEAFNIFIKDNIRVSTDKDTGFVTISMRHQSPFLAQAWTELVVRELNNFYRKKDKLEAETSVAFLSSQIAKANYAEIKQVIAELIQQKTQKLTLIEASNFYVFEYLDPPAVMEKKSEPSRSLIFFVGAFLGGCLGILIILIRYYALNKKFI